MIRNILLLKEFIHSHDFPLPALSSGAEYDFLNPVSLLPSMMDGMGNSFVLPQSQAGTGRHEQFLSKGVKNVTGAGFFRDLFSLQK